MRRANGKISEAFHSGVRVRSCVCVAVGLAAVSQWDFWSLAGDTLATQGLVAAP
jgi:hypothetical protein